MWMGIKYIVDTDILAKEIKLLGVGKGRAAMASAGLGGRKMEGDGDAAAQLLLLRVKLERGKERERNCCFSLPIPNLIPGRRTNGRQLPLEIGPERGKERECYLPLLLLTHSLLGWGIETPQLQCHHWPSCQG